MKVHGISLGLLLALYRLLFCRFDVRNFLQEIQPEWDTVITTDAA